MLLAQGLERALEMTKRLDSVNEEITERTTGESGVPGRVMGKWEG